MANIIIITKQCYLICQAVQSITLDTSGDDAGNEIYVRYKKLLQQAAKRGKLRRETIKKLGMRRVRGAQSLKEEFTQYVSELMPCSIRIEFLALSNPNAQRSNGRGDDISTLEIKTMGRDATMKLYGDIVSQIRDQIPDQLYLDKMLEKMLDDNSGDKV